MSLLSLCYDGGKRGTCSGSVLVAPFVRFHYGSLPRWLATVAATPCIAGGGGIHIVKCVSKGRRSGVRSPAPVCVRRGAVRRSPAPAGLVGGAVPRRGGGGLLPCGNGWV